LIDEQGLIERARTGESAAFRELVERYQKKIYYLALDLTGNHHDAEDLSQEVFIKSFRSLDTYRGDAKLSSWLYRITVNTNINQRRKKAFTAMKAQENLDTIHWETHSGTSSLNDPEKQAQAGLIQMHIDRALDELSVRERCVFVLRHYNDFPLNQIAEIMDINQGTVKSTLFRALMKLRKELAFYRDESVLEKIS
jgi:RNA polymerase sigma-70 factor (ECF subfamily)